MRWNSLRLRLNSGTNCDSIQTHTETQLGTQTETWTQSETWLRLNSVSKLRLTQFGFRLRLDSDSDWTQSLLRLLLDSNYDSTQIQTQLRLSSNSTRFRLYSVLDSDWDSTKAWFTCTVTDADTVKQKFWVLLQSMKVFTCNWIGPVFGPSNGANGCGTHF